MTRLKPGRSDDTTGRDAQVSTLRHELATLRSEVEEIFSRSSDFLMILDAKGVIRRVNRAAVRAMKIGPDDVIGKAWVDGAAVDQQGRLAYRLHALSKGRVKTLQHEGHWQYANGNPLLLAWIVRYSARSGCYYASARDSADKVEAERELQRHRALLGSMYDGYLAVDNRFVITSANPAAQRALKQKPGRLVGCVLWDLLPGGRETKMGRRLEQARNAASVSFFQEFSVLTNAWLEVRVFPSENGLSIFYRDITREKQMEAEKERSERRVEEILEMSPAGYVQTDGNLQVIDVNRALCEMLNVSRGELLGQDIFSFLDAASLSRPINERRSVWSGEKKLLRRGDGSVHVFWSGRLERDAMGNITQLTAFVVDIGQVKKVQSSLEHLALHDSLTGLPNRLRLERWVTERFSTSTMAHAVILLDLDGFKSVNDSAGHLVGDRLLCHVSGVLKDTLRSEDIVARIGGDEFVVVARCVEGESTARKLARKIVEALSSRALELNGLTLHTSCSAGASLFPTQGTTIEELLQAADIAMYRAKAAGRNCYRIYRSEFGSEIRRRSEIEQELRKALARNQFHLVFQPQFSLVTGEITGVETLLRWDHPRLGPIAPADFIPVAEDIGEICAIDRWVLREAVTQMREIRLLTQRELSIAFNMSVKDVMQEDLPTYMRSLLSELPYPRHLIELELTETALVGDITACRASLQMLKREGFSLALDDFGTGYSSLMHLKHFPVDVLKLDKAILPSTPAEPEEIKFFKATIDLAHAVGLKVVAEGVECEAVLKILKDCKCDTAQGYLLAHPMSSQQLLRLLLKSPPVRRREVIGNPGAQ